MSKTIQMVAMYFRAPAANSDGICVALGAIASQNSDFILGQHDTKHSTYLCLRFPQVERSNVDHWVGLTGNKNLITKVIPYLM